MKTCNGLHDDGITDGNLTKCSVSTGCGLPGCPYAPPREGPDAMTTIFTAPQDGTYLAMTVVGRLISIHWSLHMKAGESMAHPADSHVVMVMATPEGTEQPKAWRNQTVDVVKELRDMAPSLRHKIWHDNFCHCGCNCQKEA